MEFVVDGVFVIEEFFDDDMCDEWIERAEDEGFATAPVHTPEGERVAVHIRDCGEVVFHDEGAADRLAAALEEAMNEELAAGFIGVHPRPRVFKYVEDQAFAPHTDMTIEADDGRSRSRYTFLVYLNEPLEGGQTTFPVEWDDGDALAVDPIPGRGVLFEHDIMHAGAPVISGEKYILRADVLYESGV